MNKFIALTLIVVALHAFTIGCKKHESDDLSGNSEIMGKVYVEDSYSGQLKKELQNQEVFIRKSSGDSSYFLYSVKSDDKGFFRFTNISDTVQYSVFSSINMASGNNPSLVFYKSLEVTSGTKNIELILSPNNIKQNGFFIQLKDNFGQALAGARICIFNNRALALIDTCKGSIYQLTTNASGRVLQYNLPQGKYYFQASITAGVNTYKGLDSFDVPPTGIRDTSFSLNPVPVNGNGFRLLLTDVYKTPVYKTQVCVFNSRILFESANCSGSTFQLIADSTGKVFKYNIPAGRYYFRLKYDDGNVILKGADSALINSSNVLDTTFVVK